LSLLISHKVNGKVLTNMEEQAMQTDKQYSKLYLVILTVIILILFAANAQAGKANLSLKEGPYKVSNKPPPKYGKKLPVSGPIIKVYAESGTTYRHNASKLDKIPFVTSYTASCTGTGNWKVSGVSVKIGDVNVSAGNVGGGFETGTVAVEVPYNQLEGLQPVKWCNDELKTLSLENKVSKVDIVESGFGMYVDDLIEAHGTLFCSRKLSRGNVGGDKVKLGVYVSCEPNKNAGRPKKTTKTGKPKPPSGGPATTIFKSAAIAGPKSKIVGQCPEPVKFNASITANDKGTIEYQFIGDHNYESVLKKMTFAKAGTQKTSWTRTIRQPDPGKQLSMGGAKPTSEINGWMALKIIYKVKSGIASTKKTWISPKANFTVDCRTDTGTKRLRVK
jgi:hypothetical protein